MVFSPSLEMDEAVVSKMMGLGWDFVFHLLVEEIYLLFFSVWVGLRPDCSDLARHCRNVAIISPVKWRLWVGSDYSRAITDTSKLLKMLLSEVRLF